MIDVPLPESGTYIVFENIMHEKNSSRFINVVMPDETKPDFVLGRGHEADIYITDISVTRRHAVLRYAQGGFYMEDNKSKFGTLVLVDKLELSPGMSAVVQVGRTAVRFDVHMIDNSPSKPPEAMEGESKVGAFSMEIDQPTWNGEPMET